MVVSSISILMLIFPVGTYGNIGSYIFIGLILVSGVSVWRVNFENWVVISLFVFVGLFAVDVTTNGFGWSSREYIFGLLWGFFLIRYPSLDEGVLFRSLLVFLGFMIVADFLFLYLKLIPHFDRMLKEILFRRSMNDYFESYWRHVGLGGNPNSAY